MKNNKYIAIDGDIDYSTSIRIIKADVNERNTLRLKAFCQNNSRSIPVYSEYDCTGQLCGIYYNLAILQDKYIVQVEQRYDY